jgi:hypothetical protein
LVGARQIEEQKLKTEGAKQEFHAASEIVRQTSDGPVTDYLATEGFR